MDQRLAVVILAALYISTTAGMLYVAPARVYSELQIFDIRKPACAIPCRISICGVPDVINRLSTPAKLHQ